MSTRREGFSSETSQSLHGLAEALEKLKMRKAPDQPDEARPKARASLVGPVGRSLSTVPSIAVTETSSEASHRPQGRDLSASTSGRLNAVHRPRTSSAAEDLVLPGDFSMADESGSHPSGSRDLASLMSSTSGGGCLKGVTAFVDVKTEDGDDSGGIFADMLRALGARVSPACSLRPKADKKVYGRPTESCTHIIYKSGRPTTLAWFRRQAEKKPLMVGIGWVAKCKEQGQKVDEGPFTVSIEDEAVFEKASLQSSRRTTH